MTSDEFNPIDNLTPWPKGVSGNIKGKPKGTKNRSTVLKELMAATLTAKPKDAPFDLPDGVTVEYGVAAALIAAAFKGDVSAVKEIHDTIYGKITDKTETTHTIKKMGKILVEDGTQAKALEFNVGDDPLPIEGQVVREDD